MLVDAVDQRAVEVKQESRLGAIVGTAAFLLTEEWLSGVTEHWKVIFGPLLVFVAVFARGGLIGVAQKLRGMFRA